MNDVVIKHLELIQSVVERMASNSFYLKGLSITIFSAMIGVNFMSANVNLIYLAGLPIIFLGLLDTYYLILENKFIDLYDQVRIADNTDFSLTPSKVSFGDWCKITSPSILGFYGPILLIRVLLILSYLH